MAFIGNTPISVAFLTDTFSGNGSTTAFTMTVAPANTSSIIVAITGVLQDPSTYSVSGTTLTFSAAPPTGTSNISVRYLGIPASGVTTTAYRTVTNFTATAGQTSFSVPSYTVGYIDVYRNGVRLVSTDFTATTGTTVVLNNACTVGDAVVTESFYVSSVLNAIPATAGAVNTTYIADNAITTAKIAAGAVVQADLATGVAGTGPAFRATLSTQSITADTNTKMAFNTEDFDTASCYNHTGSTVGGIPAYSFLPNVAGYYQVSMNCFWLSYTAGVNQSIALNINDNGATEFARINFPSGNIGGSRIIYLNGTTDYINAYWYSTNGSSTLVGNNGAFFSNFSAVLVRAA